MAFQRYVPARVLSSPHVSQGGWSLKKKVYNAAFVQRSSEGCCRASIVQSLAVKCAPPSDDIIHFLKNLQLISVAYAPYFSP